MMFGPKKTSLMACIPISLAWILMAYADNIYTIYASRSVVKVEENPNSVLNVQDVDRTGQWNPHLLRLHSGGGGCKQERLCRHGKATFFLFFCKGYNY